MFNDKIKEKQDQLDGIKADLEKAWNATDEGKTMTKDLGKAEDDAAKAAKDYEPLKDFDKFTNPAEQEKAVEPKTGR